MSLRRAGIALMLALSGALTGCGSSSPKAACGTDEQVVHAADPVFGPIASSGDARLEKLAAAASRWGLGRVAGGVGYDYGQWLSVGGTPAGPVAWTGRDPVISFLNPDLRFRWGLRQAAVPHAWTGDADSFFQLELSPRRPMWLSSYRLTDGHRQWCAVVGDRPTRQQDHYGTAFLDTGDLLVLARGTTGSELTLLDRRTGAARWTRPVDGIDQGGYLGDLGNGSVLVGGRAAYRIGDPQTPQPAGSALVAVNAKTGDAVWRYSGDQVHVVGRSGQIVVLQQVSRQGSQQPRAPEIVGLGVDGEVRWHRPATSLGNDYALAGSALVANTGSAFVGLDPRDGHQLWRTPYPKVPQYLPYGFRLDAQPLLDAGHLLIGGTTGLHALDLGSGRIRSYPLPIDGVSTTYWPYQVVTTGGLLVVMTNTGAVVLAR